MELGAGGQKTPVPQVEHSRADFTNVIPKLKNRIHQNIAKKNKMRFRSELKNPQTCFFRKLELAGQYGVFNE